MGSFLALSVTHERLHVVFEPVNALNLVKNFCIIGFHAFNYPDNCVVKYSVIAISKYSKLSI